jgi:hypothetical protein
VAPALAIRAPNNVTWAQEIFYMGIYNTSRKMILGPVSSVSGAPNGEEGQAVAARWVRAAGLGRNDDAHALALAEAEVRVDRAVVLQAPGLALIGGQ